jgi:hypothetical protein
MNVAGFCFVLQTTWFSLVVTVSVEEEETVAHNK